MAIMEILIAHAPTRSMNIVIELLYLKARIQRPEFEGIYAIWRLFGTVHISKTVPDERTLTH
jgi:hypothetical protein